MGFLGQIINTSVFQNLVVRSYSSSSFLYRLRIPLVSQFGVFHQTAKKCRVEYHQHNSESSPHYLIEYIHPLSVYLNKFFG